jgi:multidrug efflux pump subunit AcrB
MRLWLDPDKLATLGLTAVDVQNAIAGQIIQVAAGRLGQAPAPPDTAFEFQVNAVGQLSDPQQFGDIVIRGVTTTEAVVRLRDVVARVELGDLQHTPSARFNKKPAVFIAVYQTPGWNALEVDREIRSRMAELARRFPTGIDWEIEYDTTTFVSTSTHDVVITLG